MMGRNLVRCQFCGYWIYFERDPQSGRLVARNPDGSIHDCRGT
jgi:hypothetical protein